jgi:hypothetical protein
MARYMDGSYDDAVELVWYQRRYKRTINLCPALHITLIRFAPGCARFHTFCQEIGSIEPSVLGEEWVHYLPAEVSDEEGDDSDYFPESQYNKTVWNRQVFEEKGRAYYVSCCTVCKDKQIT